MAKFKDSRPFPSAKLGMAPPPPPPPPMTEEEKAFHQDMSTQQQFHEMRGQMFREMMPRLAGTAAEEVFKAADYAARIEFKARCDEAKELLEHHKKPVNVPPLYRRMFGDS